MKIEIDLEGYTEDRFLDYVTQHLLYKEQEAGTVATQAKKFLENHVDETLEKLLTEKVGEQVDKILEGGWQPTDTWGSPKGEKMGLRERIEALLSKETGSYQNRKPLFQIIVEEKVKEAMYKEMSEELERAKKSFRKQVDEICQAKLAESLKQSLGLR